MDRARPLHVHLLGPPSVEWEGATVSITRRQVRALLYRLAATTHPLSREHLCFLFWPDTPDSAARRNLTGLLSHLRRALPWPGVLVAEDDRIWLEPTRSWSDTIAFDQVGSQSVDLYRGPFLDGFSLPDCSEYESWVALERQAWERRYLEALSVLIDELTARGDWAAAVASARRYLGTDVLAEDVHRRLIGLYAAAGQRDAALHQYEQCVAVLEHELGVSPLPETVAVYQAAVESRLLPASPPAPPAWTTLPSLSVPLVGRDEALRRLELALARASKGHGGMILISGEPGIGKSRLMQDFAGRLAGRNLVLAGTAYPDAQTTPYQPLVDALRPALLAHHASLGLQACWLAETARLIPELRVLYPNLPPPATIDSAPNRTALFEALCRVVLSLAEHCRPALLCLDDLHWADASTLDWLAFLSRRLLGQPLLVLGAYRGEEPRALVRVRYVLRRSGHLEEMELAGLDTDAVEQLLHSLAGPVVGGNRLAGQIHQATDGNPFFVLEILRTFLESGQGLESMAALETLPLPKTVREVVEARVARLGPEARQLLEAGAVLGSGFSFQLLMVTAGRSDLETAEGLDELVARHLLLSDEVGYRFRHELIRVAVYRSLSPWRQRVLHRRAGQALEQRQPESAAVLARHFELADEPERAAGHARRAGHKAKTLFAHVEARAWFERALALLERHAATLREPAALAANRRLRIEVLYDRGWALRLLGDMEAYACDLEEVARLAHFLGDPLTLAHLRWRQAYTHRWFCRYAEARACAVEGIALARAADDARLRAMCLREAGLAARESGNYATALAELEEALALFSEAGETVYEIHALGNLATLHWYLSEYVHALALGRQALARCEEAGLPLERRLPLGDMGAAAAALGAAEAARHWLDESLEIARQVADRTQEILCPVHLGWLALRQAQPAEALEHFQAGLELAERIGSCTEQGWLLSGLAEAYRRLGEDGQAVVHARRALELAATTRRPYDEELARRILARLP